MFIFKKTKKTLFFLKSPKKQVGWFFFLKKNGFFSTLLGIYSNSFVESMRVVQQDHWIVTMYQKHFDLGKTRSAATDYVTWKATVDVSNCIDYVAHDWHRLVDKLAIFVKRWCALFCSARSLVFHSCKIFVAGLVNVVNI